MTDQRKGDYRLRSIAGIVEGLLTGPVVIEQGFTAYSVYTLQTAYFGIWYLFLSAYSIYEPDVEGWYRVEAIVV